MQWKYETTEENILKNRANISKGFNLKKLAPMTFAQEQAFRTLHPDVDHLECYTTRHNTFVVFSSVYGKMKEPLGSWENCLQIYSAGTTTYAMVFPTRWLFNDAMRPIIKACRPRMPK